jgi:hypothetical protein
MVKTFTLFQLLLWSFFGFQALAQKSKPSKTPLAPKGQTTAAESKAPSKAPSLSLSLEEVIEFGLALNEEEAGKFFTKNADGKFLVTGEEGKISEIRNMQEAKAADLHPVDAVLQKLPKIQKKETLRLTTELYFNTLVELFNTKPELYSSLGKEFDKAFNDPEAFAAVVNSALDKGHSLQ